MKNQIKTGAVMSYVNMAVGSLIPMLYTPIMLQLLGQNEYGLSKLAGTLTSYLSLISLGIGSAVVRYLIKFRVESNKDGEERIFGLFNVIFGIIAAIAFIAGMVLCISVPRIYSASLTSTELYRMQILVAIMTISMAVDFATSPYISVVTCHERFIFLQSINIITTIASPVANLIVLFMGYKSIGMAVSSFILSLIVRIIYIIYVRKHIHIKPKYRNMPVYLIKEILFFSFWVFVSNIVSQLYNATDTMIIGAVPALATVGVAIYNVGATFSGMMLNFSLGISNVLTPRVNQMVFSKSSNEELSDLLIKIGRLQSYIVGIVCSGFIAFGRQFINLWVGPDYNEAYWVAISTMIPSCIPLMQTIAMNVIVAQNKHRFRSLVYLFIAVINVIGTLLAVNRFGIIGAAVVSGLANVLGQGLIMNWYYWKKIGLDIPRFWVCMVKQLTIPICLCIASLILFNFINLDNWIFLFIGIAVYSALFIILSWFLVMDTYEKDIFRKPINSIISKFSRKGEE